MSSADPLQLLRIALSASKPPFLTRSSEAANAEAERTDTFVDATHLYFTYPSPQCISLSSITRFTSTNPDTTPVDLRSIFFAWTQKDVTVPEYLANTADLDKQLPEGKKIRNLVFVERIDLITWLEGASDESEYIKPLERGADDATNKATEAAGAVPTVEGVGIGVTQQTAGGRPVKVIDARLQQIYNGERKMIDHNTVLRGIKPTDFSHVRKYKELFAAKGSKTSSRPNQSSRTAQLTNRPAPLPSKPLTSAVSSKRADPIIMLSPSASSLLRMSNIKTFLETGLFVPFDHPQLANQSVPNLLHLTRTMRSLSEKPYRFIIVDSADNFKQEYWNRVVAVFTTGQTWQFKSYRWSSPQELFGHVLGIFVGEKGQPVPSDVKGWGSSVRTFSVERWDERGHGANVDPDTRVAKRWKDREVVEELWRSVEGYMRSKGEWKR